MKVNLFVDALTDYLTSQCESVLRVGSESNKITLVVQSLPLRETIAVLERLDAYFVTHYPGTAHALKIAHGLWKSWPEADKYAFAHSDRVEREWVDLDDQLTTFRNQGHCVFFGFDHASDKGSLKDFHLVTEDTLWVRVLEKHYGAWVERLAEHLDDPDERAKAALLGYLETVERFNARRLVRVARFIEAILVTPVGRLSDLVLACYAQLPAWGALPLLGVSFGRNLARTHRMIELGHRFSTHAMFVSKADRDKAIKKIDEAEAGTDTTPAFLLPEPLLAGNSDYQTGAGYLEDVRRFVRDDDAAALERLRRWDATPLLALLETKTRKKPTSRAATLKGQSDVVFLQALVLSLQRFITEYGNELQAEEIYGITITLTHYDTDTGNDRDELRQLLNGILGTVVPEQVELVPNQPAVAVTFVGIEEVEPRTTRATPKIGFTVTISSSASADPFEQQFVWPVPTSHPERLRLALARLAVDGLTRLALPRLPAFRIGGFDELFAAIDADDVHRLLLLGMNDFAVENVFDEVAQQPLYAELVASCSELTGIYQQHLATILKDGFYVANRQVSKLITAYSDVVARVLQRTSSSEYVLPHMYRAFLTVRTDDDASRSHLDAAVVLPISPFVLELCGARAIFLQDGFGEVVARMFEDAASARQQWERLVELAELRRPVTALVADANYALSSSHKAFGLTHLVGDADPYSLPAASQSLMRQDHFDADDLGPSLQPTAASRVYEDVIRDYQRLHGYAYDRLSLLFTNVTEIDVVLAGVNQWLKGYLADAGERSEPFHLSLKVITTGVATTTALNMLVAWKEAWAEGDFTRQRPCSIRIGHRHASSSAELEAMLDAEAQLGYDISFIAHFLDERNQGNQLEPAAPFDVVEATELRHFPLTEYPRPITQLALHQRRHMSISNRRLEMASHHTEIAARLRAPHTPPEQRHTVITQIDFSRWRSAIERLHQTAVWVCCVDRHIDSHLVAGAALGPERDRRIVGFSCGLGNYGELNQTVSTEVNDLATLTKAIAKRLRQLLHTLSKESALRAARQVIDSACVLPGLSLVRAAGNDEYVRNVVGYALIGRLVGEQPDAHLQALIPLDSFGHWFRDREEPYIPDLLLLTARVVEGRLHLDATVIECKFANESQGHIDKAYAQVSSGLRQLLRIFSPRNAPVKTTLFDRKYWWAQLYRALSSRAVVTLAPAEYRDLCRALDRLGEGDFTIAWRAFASTFWTNRSQADGIPNFVEAVDVDLSQPLPKGFGVYQLEYGTDAVIRLLTDIQPAPLAIPGTPLVLTAGRHTSNANNSAPVPSRSAVSRTDGRQADGEADEPPHPVPPLPPRSPISTPTPPVQKEPPLSDAASAVADDDDGGETPPMVFAAPLPPPAIHLPESAPIEHPTQHIEEPSVARVLLGTDGRNEGVYWEYGAAELENRHLLIFGGSGSGKTYAIQCLLHEMAKQGQHSAIVDYTDGFLPSHLDPRFNAEDKPVTHVLVREPFPINPFQRLTRDEPGIGELPERPHNVASRVSDVFCSVYDVGDVQRAALAKHIEQGLSGAGPFGLDQLLASLESDPAVPPTLALKITELVKQRPFSDADGSGWANIFAGQSPIHILQLTGLSKDVQRLITEFALWDFFAYATRHGNTRRPLPVVLDEVQNLDHRPDRAIDKLLREGRKFGVGMILATQTISNFNKEQRSRLFQCAQKLFFKPAETERKEFAQILADVSLSRSRDEWIVELSKLGKGECWAIGPHRVGTRPLRRDPIKLRITSLESR